MRLGDIEFGKLQFLAEFQIMRNKTFIEAAICSAWKKTGLIPFNLEIGSRILEYRICLTTPPSELIPDTILDRIPYSAKEIVDQGVLLQCRILCNGL